MSSVKVAADLGELAEEVADVILSTLIQDLEVIGELDGGVSTDMRSNGDLKCSNDRKGECFTRGGDKAAGEHRRNPRQRACCWPSVLVKERRLGFLGLKEEESKGSSGR